MVSFLTGSLGEFLDRNYESEKVKTLILANNVYGKHGGPYDAGTALGPALPPALRGRARGAGLHGPRDGRDGGDHGGHGLGVPQARRRDPHGRAGGPHSRGRRARPGSRPRGRHRDRRAARALERRPQAHVPRLRRGFRPARRLPRGRGRDQDGRALCQGEPRPERGAPLHRDARRLVARRALSLHPGAVARVRGAVLRPGQDGPHPRRALGRLRRGLERGPEPGARRPARDDLLRPVRARTGCARATGTPSASAWAISR